MRFFRLPAIYLVPAVALWVGVASLESWARESEIAFADAEIFFELNNTDGDLGLHSAIDGEPWKRLKIEAPNDRKLLDIRVRHKLRRQGLTQLEFESAEPDFEELPSKKFFRRFPEGEYTIEGKTIEGDKMESTAILTHLLPAPPENITVNGFEVPEDCEQGPVPLVSGPVTIAWDAVTESHPELGRTGEPIEVVLYQVVVEQMERELSFNIELSPDMAEVVLPETFADLGGEYKLEILVREESGNQTAIETCFEIE
jgi:hypothetical protein